MRFTREITLRQSLKCNQKKKGETDMQILDFFNGIDGLDSFDL